MLRLKGHSPLQWHFLSTRASSLIVRSLCFQECRQSFTTPSAKRLSPLSSQHLWHSPERHASSTTSRLLTTVTAEYEADRLSQALEDKARTRPLRTLSQALTEDTLTEPLLHRCAEVFMALVDASEGVKYVPGIDTDPELGTRLHDWIQHNHSADFKILDGRYVADMLGGLLINENKKALMWSMIISDPESCAERCRAIQSVNTPQDISDVYLWRARLITGLVRAELIDCNQCIDSALQTYIMVAKSKLETEPKLKRIWYTAGAERAIAREVFSRRVANTNSEIYDEFVRYQKETNGAKKLVEQFRSTTFTMYHPVHPDPLPLLEHFRFSQERERRFLDRIKGDKWLRHYSETTHQLISMLEAANHIEDAGWVRRTILPQINLPQRSPDFEPDSEDNAAHFESRLPWMEDSPRRAIQANRGFPQSVQHEMELPSNSIAGYTRLAQKRNPGTRHFRPQKAQGTVHSPTDQSKVRFFSLSSGKPRSGAHSVPRYHL